MTKKGKWPDISLKNTTEENYYNLFKYLLSLPAGSLDFSGAKSIDGVAATIAQAIRGVPK